MTIYLNYKTILIAFIAVLISFFYHDKLDLLYKSFVKVINKPKQISGVLTQEELAQFNGVDNDKLYVVVLGSIFDVTKGKKHYRKGDGAYNYFVGKDGSRAFVTGKFNDESSIKDHVLDLSCDDLHSLKTWNATYTKKYKYVGMHIGRYYDYDGEETQYMKEFNAMLNDCKTGKEQQKQEEIKFPPCNISWDHESGTKVWCTKTSGGISRNWTGVPRQLFTPGHEKPRCACINPLEDHSNALLKPYENCPSTAVTCVVAD